MRLFAKAGADASDSICMARVTILPCGLMAYKGPSLAVDCIVFDDRDRLLLIRRRHPPFEGQFALPGGFVDYGETTEAAAGRELLEETGLTARTLRLVGVYSDPKRDPRGHTIGVAYLTTIEDGVPAAGDDAAEAEFRDDWQELDLAFDHNVIVRDAVKMRGNS